MEFTDFREEKRKLKIFIVDLKFPQIFWILLNFIEISFNFLNYLKKTYVCYCFMVVQISFRLTRKIPLNTTEIHFIMRQQLIKIVLFSSFHLI